MSNDNQTPTAREGSPAENPDAITPPPGQKCYFCGEVKPDLNHVDKNEVRNDRPTGRLLRRWWVCDECLPRARRVIVGDPRTPNRADRRRQAFRRPDPRIAHRPNGGRLS